ncbi:MAG: hypothetical protein LBU89_00280 [Fibromonadaceae bacterium]|jgi:hypothetical protein|nr:hypothetical protein [Fibromonadaceae bacterium]
MRFLLLLPPLFALTFVACFGVNLPFWDEWEIPLALNDVLERGLQFGDLWNLHNEHRIFFPAMVYLLSAYFTDFNVKINMYIGWFFQSGIYLLVLLYFKKTIENEKHFIPWALCLGFIVFNFVQFENQLWGFQVGFFMCAFFIAATFYFLDSFLKTENIKYAILSLIFGISAGLTSLQGLFVFPVALILLFLANKKKYLFYTFLFTLLFFAIYFSDYQVATTEMTQHYVTKVYDIFKVFFVCLGAPLIKSFIFIHPTFPSIITATASAFNFVIILGFIFFIFCVCLVIYLFRKKQIKDFSFSICLIFFAFAFALAISFGRNGEDIGLALMSRYTTFTLLGYVGLILALIKLKPKLPSVKYAFSILLFMLILQNGIVFNLEDRVKFRISAKEKLQNYKNLNEQELMNIDMILNRCPPRACIELLEKRKWSVFAE